jgi:hypothetical protein
LKETFEERIQILPRSIWDSPFLYLLFVGELLLGDHVLFPVGQEFPGLEVNSLVLHLPVSFVPDDPFLSGGDIPDIRAVFLLKLVDPQVNRLVADCPMCSLVLCCVVFHTFSL